MIGGDSLEIVLSSMHGDISTLVQSGQIYQYFHCLSAYVPIIGKICKRVTLLLKSGKNYGKKPRVEGITSCGSRDLVFGQNLAWIFLKHK